MSIFRATALFTTSAFVLTLSSAAMAGGIAPEVISEADAAAIEAATAAGACGDQAVLSATINAAGQIEAVCDTGDVTAFVPLLGGLAPLLGAAGVAAVAAVAAGGGDGGGTSGTTN